MIGGKSVSIYQAPDPTNIKGAAAAAAAAEYGIFTTPKRLGAT